MHLFDLDRFVASVLDNPRVRAAHVAMMQERGDDSPSPAFLTGMMVTVTVAPSGSLPNFGAHKHPQSSTRLSKVADATVPAGGSCAHRKSACWRRIAQLQPTLAHEDWSLEFIKISISRVTQSTEMRTDFWNQSRVLTLRRVKLLYLRRP